MSEYLKKLKSAKTDELAQVIADESEKRADQRVRQRMQRMSEKAYNLTIQQYDGVIQRYGLDFCIQLGKYAASKKACGK